MINWIKIDDNNKPVFGKQYLLGRKKKGVFKTQKIYAGKLEKIEITEKGEEYIYKVGAIRDYLDTYYQLEKDITHFIEISFLTNQL